MIPMILQNALRRLPKSVFIDNRVSADNMIYSLLQTLKRWRKKKCTKVDDEWYKNSEIIPDLTNEEIMLIMEEANYKNIKIIKYNEYRNNGKDENAANCHKTRRSI